MSYHQPVLLKESIQGLNIKPDGIYVDLTFGGGGHTREILKKLNKNGRLFAFDQDKDAEKNVPEDNRLVFIRHNFRYMKNYLKYFNAIPVNGILADLGVSSHHLDEAGRGFSFRHNTDLDMRMNQDSRLTAQEVINNYEAEELKKIFRLYGDVKNAHHLARLIPEGRKKMQIKTIPRFLEVIAPCIPQKNKHKYLAKVFQALRIEVNKEIDNLKTMLMQANDVIDTGGRLVIIGYHSAEDRLIKLFMKSGNFKGVLNNDFYGNIIKPFRQLNSKVIMPTEEEVKNNNRARSAKLRIAEKVQT
jgi:16S rRNA (cytosine1402-N4)-methyltransferase